MIKLGMAEPMSVLDRFRLDGKVTVVTGASKNIGLEISRAFAQAGATVAMVARGRELLEQRADEIRTQTGASILTFTADVGSKRDVARLIEQVHGRFDQVDTLVNNAYSSGATQGVSVFDIEERSWEETIAANVLGPFRLCQAFGKRMAAGRGGSFINILSGSGLRPSPELTPYGTTKAALWMMTRYLARECAPKVRANGLCPGITVSDTGGPTSDHLIEALAKEAVLGRVGHPTDLGPAAVYLASDAASYTTGALLVVNGGRLW
jgi:NAD(P)-dependent dehydrogenase (short-subunit alcohol dehydrogenase family)